MAKKKRKGGYRRKGRRRGTKAAVPKTFGGVWRNAPLAVKGGAAVTGLDMLGDTSFGGVPLSTRIVNLAKGTDSTANVINALKGATVNPKNYKPVVVGFLIHWVNKKTIKIKGV